MRREPSALVFFSDKSDHWWGRFLKPGYRHCLVAVEARGGWVIADPTIRGLRLDIAAMDGESLVRLATLLGLKVIRVSPVARTAGPYAVPAVAGCSGMVAAILGLPVLSCLTPWRLYKKIMKKNENNP